MLIRLSIRNIRKSLRDYAVYFFTLIIGVSIFYIFNAIGDQTVYMEFSDSKRELVKLLTTTLSGISVFVTCVLGLLIVYANRFLIKRRKKEFAVYLTLGMGKKQISAIILVETLIVGVGSLIAGLALGIGLSQLMSALVANLFEADMTAYKFTVSPDAIIKTVICLAIMYLVVMLFNSIVISHVKLIDLIQADKKSEKIKLKNPILCVIIFIIACLILAVAYYQVGWNYNALTSSRVIACIIAGVIATILIFWSISGLLLRIFMSAKGVYFKNINSFTFRQISSKINTMVVSMSIICLMLFVIICTLSASFSVRNSLNANLTELCPADCQLTYTKYTDDLYSGTESGNIVKLYAKYGYDITEPFSEYVHFPVYSDNKFTFADFLGDELEEIRTQFPYLNYDSGLELVKLSDYNSLMTLYGKEQISMNDDEYILLCDYKSIKAIWEQAMPTEIEIFGHTLSSRYDECQDGFLELSSQHINTGIFIVPDNTVQENGIKRDYLVGNYPGASQAEKASAEKASAEKAMLKMQENLLDSFDKSGDEDTFMISTNTKIDIYESTISLGAIITFIGLYIGLVFLITCGAVLALKELSESVDSIGRYEILRKIGVEEKQISKSLLIQTGVFFLLPLLVASVHSIFGMKFAVHTLESIGTDKYFGSVILTGAIIILIYGGYFLVTYFSSKGIINKKR